MESSSSSSSTVLNKIIIPVVTTVLGATAIYFLGFNKKGSSGRTDMEQMLISKEATVKGWKSFVTTQNIGYNNMKSISEEFMENLTKMKETNPGVEKVVSIWTDFKDGLFREVKKSNKDIQGILEEKDLDRDFVSFLNRALENGKSDEKKSGAFFDDITALIRSNEDQQQKTAKYQAMTVDFMRSNERIVERSATEAEGIGKILAERYTQAFDLNDLLVYVDYKKEKEKKAKEQVPNNQGGPAPVDPNNTGGGTEAKTNNNPPADNGGTGGSRATDNSYSNVTTNTNTNNTVEPTKSLLAGAWTMNGGELELSPDGEMFWSFGTRGYTSGDWRLEDGKIRMNVTNPDTRATSLIIGHLSNFTRNSFTLTFMTTPREVYHLRRSDD